ncbi:type VII secretion-associated serine protease mycosin [Actinokineospora guangxiensis]|uniref:Type VII secretion-associated serine protease mycosin n=1 Tax=Actinokineospora guangxiensis TaxID=1490288 RepID=A0ABW0EIJ0_9PSEU
MARRCAAAALAAVLACAVPAGALAQETSFADPPPVDMSKPVPSSAIPDATHTQKTACVTDLPRDVDIKGAPWGQDRLQFDELRKFATGKNVTVAVIDTGVTSHQWLKGRVSGAGDYIQKGGDGLSDCDGHGTVVAGIIAAKPPSDVGFRGIAPDARILSIRQSSTFFERETTDGGKEPAGTLATLASAIVRAVEQDADVVNMSVNRCRPSGPITEDEKVLQRALRFAHDKGVVLVTSAGNVNEDRCKESANGFDPNNPTNIVTPPWFDEYVLSVGAMDRNGDPAAFTVQGPWVGVSAPGTEITSLNPAGDGLANQRATANGDRAPIEGTSFAAPYVAGLAALVKERYPELTARQVMDRIKLTAAHPAAHGGRDNLVGYGMVNPVSALTAMIPAEQGVEPAVSEDVRMAMPPAVPEDLTPMRVALIGAGGGVLLLLVTLFVVHTVRRNRPELRSDPRGQA